MQRRLIRRSDPRYKQLRVRNNESVKKSRDKSRREQEETIESIEQLEKENEQLIDNLRLLKDEYQQLQIIFKQHTGIDIDQTSTDLSTPPKPIEEKQSSIDTDNLDGSIVLINGVQYKIVSMNQN